MNEHGFPEFQFGRFSVFHSPQCRAESIPTAKLSYGDLSNIWCGKCRDEVTITNFTCAVRGGDLLLVGKCSICQGDVARVVER